MKRTCEIHCFTYEGERCPFCEKERTERLAKFFHYDVSVHEGNAVGSGVSDRYKIELTDDDIRRLSTRFNVKMTKQ